MDELFRKAAEAYPLDTSTRDWNKVAAMLQGEMEQPASKPKNNYRRFGWLLLLLPLYLICNKAVTPDSLERQSNKNQPSTAADPIQNSFDNNRSAIPATQDPGFSGNATASEILVKPTAGKTVASTSQSIKNLSGSNHPGQPYKNYNSYQVNHSQKRMELSTLPKNEEGSFKPAPSSLMEEETLYIKTAAVKFINKEQPTTGKKEITRTNIVDANSTSRPGRNLQKKFYAGLMAGADMTTIKMQRSEKLGHEYGVVLGYSFNRKWSLEGAAFLQKKSYYSHGKYLTSSKVYRPANAEITDVNAVCNMIDLSLAAKFNFRKTDKTEVFSTAGISSYLMKKEDYSFVYYYPQSGISYPYSHVYNNESRNYLSVLNLSVGYSRQIGKAGAVRIEPYVKLPLKELGFGGLPLMSTGIRVGIVKNMF